jgi:hypothetical protein
MRIGLIPMDDRPVNTTLPAMIAAVAGAVSAQPEAADLGLLKEPGSPDRILEWLVAEIARLDRLVVSLEMAGYGGLIPSRTSSEPSAAVLARIGALTAVCAERPELPVYASSLVTRASDSYSDVEEPEYWARYGREIHALGGALHRRFLGEEAPEPVIPADVRRDVLVRRMRNYTVNIDALRLAASGAFDVLLLTSDDTAVHSFGSLERRWLEHWTNALGSERKVLFYPGADEVGSVLTARALAREHDAPVRFWITCVEPDGLERVANFENVPVGSSVLRQVAASGGIAASSIEQADVALVVHAPSPGREDYFASTPPGTTPAALVDAIADRVTSLLDEGIPTAIADVRYSNGGDPKLVAVLAERGVLLALTAYAGWNTAGNSVGTTVAHATAFVRGRNHGTLDGRAHMRLLQHRLLEDVAYQSGIRRDVDGAEVDLQLVARRLCEEAARLFGPAAFRVRPSSVRAPWSRSFEIDFDLDAPELAPSG